MNLRPWLLSAALLFSTQTLASDITVSGAYARETPPGVPNSAAFMTLNNQSARTRTLVAAHSTAARHVELHNHVKVDDAMKMRRVDSISIEPHQHKVLAPGGYHVMLLGLVRPLREGEPIRLTLEFADGERLSLQLPVKKVMAGIAPQHTTMPPKGTSGQVAHGVSE